MRERFLQSVEDYPDQEKGNQEQAFFREKAKELTGKPDIAATLWLSSYRQSDPTTPIQMRPMEGVGGYFGWATIRR